MNEEIEKALMNLEDDGKKVPVYFLNYTGKGETYVTYNSSGDFPALAADDDLLNSVIDYDVHIFSQSNYGMIEAAVKALLKKNGWTWTGSSEDQFEPDTKYYHKVNSFQKERSY